MLLFQEKTLERLRLHSFILHGCRVIVVGFWLCASLKHDTQSGRRNQNTPAFQQVVSLDRAFA